MCELGMALAVQGRILTLPPAGVCEAGEGPDKRCRGGILTLPPAGVCEAGECPGRQCRGGFSLFLQQVCVRLGRALTSDAGGGSSLFLQQVTQSPLMRHTSNRISYLPTLIVPPSHPDLNSHSSPPFPTQVIQTAWFLTTATLRRLILLPTLLLLPPLR